MAKIVKLWAKQAVNSALYHRNGLNMTLVHDLLFNSEVLIWHESSNWTGPYHLLAVKNKTCCVQLFSGLTSFKSMSIKPYFWPKNIYNIKPDKLETPPPALKAPKELTKPIKLIIKRDQRRP